MSAPLILKFGGDALATPERIAAAARLIAARHATRPVVAVASARRGVTDHLVRLAEQVQSAIGAEARPGPAELAATDRALASGEIVAASLLALALARLGVAATPLDAREAGLASDGWSGRARLQRIRPGTIQRLLAADTVPIVAGFQGWNRGRVTTLGRGGSDTTAVALAVALGAEGCELLKATPGLLDADPRVVPAARPLPHVSHAFLSALAASGAKVMHHPAAVLAEREGLPLRFVSFEASDEPGTRVTRLAPSAGTAAVAVWPGRARFTARLPVAPAADLTDRVRGRCERHGLHPDVALRLDGTGAHLDLVVDGAQLEDCLEAASPLLPGMARPVLVATGLSSVTVVTASVVPERRVRRAVEDAAARTGAHLRTAPQPHRRGFLVADADAPGLVRALHDALVDAPASATPGWGAERIA